YFRTPISSSTSQLQLVRRLRPRQPILPPLPAACGDLGQPLFHAFTREVRVMPLYNRHGVPEHGCNIRETATLTEPKVHGSIAETVRQIAFNPQARVIEHASQVGLPKPRRAVREAGAVPKHVTRVPVHHGQ